MLTVMEFAVKYGMASGSEHAVRQRVLRRIRRLEKATGRNMLVSTGSGPGRRFLVREDTEDARVSDDVLSELADAMAAQITALEDRHTNVSTGLAEIRRSLEKTIERVARLERKR
jgi:alkanesulfonate monooxygenase SsuD/methylene tetrahydromethanopterin reductase-like flavin-dependent oxidoreductase (luciferase family)